MADLQFRNNADAFRYEVLEGDAVVSQADYTVNGDVVSITHTGTPPEYRGRGLAGDLVKFALDDIRQQDGKVVPLCPFVASYIADHPEYADLVSRG